MNVYFYKAECGDAARLRFIGSDNKPHNIFIDSGYDRTFRYVLAEEITSIHNAGESIDLWIISHIHDDHIGGAIAYIDCIKDGKYTDIVSSWWYNAPRASYGSSKDHQPSTISLAKSIAQGDTLADYLIYKNKLTGSDITSHLPEINLFGLKIVVLSPDIRRLEQLRNKYPLGANNPFEENEISAISDPKSLAKYDYHMPLRSFDLKKWQEDNSVENGSSISVLTEFGGKRILWLADAQPTVVLRTLQKLGYSSSNPLVCDWVKVTHHGSKGNNSSSLYELIKCDNYLISSNGENIHCLPSKECIARILSNPFRNNSKYNLYFTYDNKTLRDIFKVDGDTVFEEFNFNVKFVSENKKMLTV